MLSLETRIDVRNLQDGDAFRGAGDEFPEGWSFDREWVWVAITDRPDVPVAAVIASPCHGIVLIHRVWVSKGHSKTLLPLLRRFLKDCLNRGFRGYMSYVNVTKKEQVRLLRIAGKARAQIVTRALLCFGGKLEDAARY